MGTVHPAHNSANSRAIPGTDLENCENEPQDGVLRSIWALLCSFTAAAGQFFHGIWTVPCASVLGERYRPRMTVLKNTIISFFSFFFFCLFFFIFPQLFCIILSFRAKLRFVSNSWYSCILRQGHCGCIRSEVWLWRFLGTGTAGEA